MQIREATMQDIKPIYEMLLNMHSETKIKLAPVKPEKLYNTIKLALEEGIVLVAEIKNKIVGSIAGIANTDWWSDEKSLRDLWFYVRPENRKSTVAIKLVKNFIYSGNSAKLKIKLGHVFSGDIERKDKFFERLGLTKAGSLYVEI
jgi:N-acetylglutamate synthase-like GNAT family acetyltransferase|tara:strand:+ start:2749 stop:3186 length:438 start_codon:yes stop_codon:yes gene_type:complete